MSELSPLLMLGAFELAAKIRAGEVTPSEVVAVHIARLRAVNPVINAIVEDRFAEATKEAEEKTQQLPALKAAGSLPPLFGVPFTVKEMLAAEGFKSTAGNIHRKDNRRDFTGTIVERAKKAGAILLATSNVPELGFWFECENPIYGRTNNPYDPAKTSGGSSGGEGALIGAGGSPFGLGSDIGGSIRLPAAFCGVFGHKPTHKLLPMTGHFPYTREEIKAVPPHRYPLTVLGPIARKAKDLGPLLDLLRGADDFDPVVKDQPSLSPGRKDVENWKVLVCADPVIHLTRRADREVSEAVHNSARLFEQFGAKVSEFDPRFFVSAVEMWGAAVKASKDRTFRDALNPTGSFTVATELFRTLTGRGNYSLPGLLTALIETKVVDDPGRSAELLEGLENLKAKFARALDQNTILLFPAFPRTAPAHRSALLSPFDFMYTGVFNAMGNPVTAAPVGLSKNGLPLAVQIVAAPFQDHLAISAAEVLEDGFGGWSPPSL